MKSAETLNEFQAQVGGEHEIDAVAVRQELCMWRHFCQGHLHWAHAMEGHQ
eukprot:CAMPEP_0180797188 /NCGR_PEP_ID=MMETSP1038_2-20121128/57227_1 /TAXON_ID=632150 /ORGANISM="Azadinium spinosum, Strain 3D9" /LENGTH=50 /DNA_ID=CAMNT_0022836413 /DNA_START=261 /DNA_END=413 /DNA_ORIENTATION=-